MPPFNAEALAMALYLAPMGLFIALFRIVRWLKTPTDRRTPLTREFLREPGHSLRKELEDVQSDLIALMAATGPLPLFMYVELQGRHRSTVWVAIFVVLTASGLVYLTWRIAHLVRRSQALRLGLAAEMAIGQELTDLMPSGFWVFHDVKGDGPFNVDHVVVGTHGVFAVETKGRAKPILERGDGHRVTLVEDRLEFPSWVEREPLLQARRNAAWLGQWLTSAIGEKVHVRPVLALPGWYVERKSTCDVAVINGRNARGYFTHTSPSTLSPAVVARIKHQLDARCRDVPMRA